MIHSEPHLHFKGKFEVWTVKVSGSMCVTEEGNRQRRKLQRRRQVKTQGTHTDDTSTVADTSDRSTKTQTSPSDAFHPHLLRRKHDGDARPLGHRVGG